MASKKISALAALSTPVDADLLAIVDVSDSSMGASGTDKKITFADLVGDALDAKQDAASAATDTELAAEASARATADGLLLAKADNLASLANAATARGNLGAENVANKDTDTALSANSDTKYASQKAVKAYVDGLLAASDAVVYKGAIDCSANPNYPAADAGHLYRVSVAGKIGGASGVNVEAGDTLLCNTDATAAGTQAAVGTKWNVIQVNIDGAVIGPASATDGHIPQFNGTTGKLLKDGLPLDTDNTLAANSDTRVASQKATKGYVDTASGLLVPKSLVDAKGDLLVGTADNTVARKAVGTDGTFLRADSSQSDGLAWGPAVGLALPNFRTGAYYAPPLCGSAGAGDPGTVAGRLFALLFPVAVSTTFDRIGLWLNAVYGAGSNARLGIYPVTSGLQIAVAPSLDAGVIDCTTGAGTFKTLTISKTLAAGWYALVMGCESGWTTGTGAMWRIQQASLFGHGSADSALGDANFGFGSYASGSLPTPGPAISNGGLNAPLLKLRAA